MKLPGAERAIVDLAKLSDYCLNPDHPRGQHKARVFASVLGITADQAEDLRAILLTAAYQEEAVPGQVDNYGERYTIDFEVQMPVSKAWLRSSWIVHTDEDFPRLVTCYVL